MLSWLQFYTYMQAFKGTSTHGDWSYHLNMLLLTSVLAAELVSALKAHLKRWAIISRAEWKQWEANTSHAYHTGTHLHHLHNPSGHHKATHWKCSSRWGRRSGLLHISARERLRQSEKICVLLWRAKKVQDLLSVVRIWSSGCLVLPR